MREAGDRRLPNGTGCAAFHGFLDGDPAPLPLTVSFARDVHQAPVVIFSHGQGLSHCHYGPLVAHLVAAGFAVVQPHHEGVAAELWRSRIADVKRIIHCIERLMAAPELAGRLDPARIAVIGHSYGGHTAAACAGASIRDPATGQFVDLGAPAVRAVVLLAPPGHFDGLVADWKTRAPYLAMNWQSMRGPMLLIAGADDAGAMTGLGWRWHTDAYVNAGPGNKCLVVMSGAGHYLGGIDGRATLPDSSAARVALVGAMTAAFLHAAFDATDNGWATLRAALPANTTLIQSVESK